MQQEKGSAGQARKVNRKPAVTPDMFWPAPQKTRARAPESATASTAAARPSSTVDPMSRPPTGDAKTVISLADAASRAMSRMNHPSNRARRITRPSPPPAPPEPVVILGEGGGTVDLSDCGNVCGNGVWCEACRSDIRSEALRWLKELNVVRPPSGANLLWGPAWSRQFLLADY